MVVQLVVAADERNGIGKDNKLPWHLPNDLKFFKEKTLGHPVIMGRKTFDSLGKPLPRRTNVVLTRQQLALPEGVIKSDNLTQVVAHFRAQEESLISIIGGGEIFKEAIHHAQRIWLTRVHTVIENADVFFPQMDSAYWLLHYSEKHEADERHQYDYTFEEWVRKLVM